MHLSNAIVRRPGRSIVNGLSMTASGTPVYEKALEQHAQYVKALGYCGLEVKVLDCLEGYPDATFVEDVAILTPDCAIITAPGAPSRRGEVEAIKPVLNPYYSCIECIHTPGTLEGGDLMQVGNHLYIGLSQRTNEAGARQLTAILEKYGITASTVPVVNFLHLKTAVTYVGQNHLMVAEGFALPEELQSFKAFQVPIAELPAANCILINDKIMMSAGFPRTQEQLGLIGTEIVAVDISEFAKIDGGLTCLSLRF
ncbi:MAG: arginine deiminase family protein [Deltaproteobacteria bacterium]|nr:arginine deiminase family protein [Deltaproteobacteria bacterium]